MENLLKEGLIKMRMQINTLTVGVIATIIALIVMAKLNLVETA